jgi:hypothetical protein
MRGKQRGSQTAVRLIDEKSGARINLGHTAQTFRGEPVVVRGWGALRSRASFGRVYVEFEDRHTASSYPSVINAKVDDQ